MVSIGMYLKTKTLCCYYSYFSELLVDTRWTLHILLQYNKQGV